MQKISQENFVKQLLVMQIVNMQKYLQKIQLKINSKIVKITNQIMKCSMKIIVKKFKKTNNSVFLKKGPEISLNKDLEIWRMNK